MNNSIMGTILLLLNRIVTVIATLVATAIVKDFRKTTLVIIIQTIKITIAINLILTTIVWTQITTTEIITIELMKCTFTRQINNCDFVIWFIFYVFILYSF
jgi:hypothetical protein